jgi:dTDP-4-amino-4,6-dideoxygalactose transaminase
MLALLISSPKYVKLIFDIQNNMSPDKKRKITVGTVDIGEKGIKLVEDTLRRGRISGGANVRQFESLFADYHRMPYCVAVATGTDADTLALASFRYLGHPSEGEVLVPALNFVAVANAVIHAGYTPRFVDVSPTTWNMDVSAVREAISAKTVGMIPTHLFGRPCDMDPLVELARQNGLFVVEDSAEAHGSKYKGRLAGTMGDVGTFSFYVAHIITTGEGGAIITREEPQAEILRSLRAHGRACSCVVCKLNVDSSYCSKRFGESGELEDSRFSFLRIGYSSKMNDLEAAIGIDQMERLDNIIQARHNNLFYLNSSLSAYHDYISTMVEDEHEQISALCYPILVNESAPFTRRQLVEHLENAGIETRPAFGSIPTQQPAYEFLGHKLGEFPHSEAMGRRGLYIGVHQNLSKEDLDYILEIFGQFFKGHAD